MKVTVETARQDACLYDVSNDWLPFCESRYRLGEKIPQTAKTGMIWVSNDYVVENFDFEKLTGSNEVAGNFDIRFRRG